MRIDPVKLAARVKHWRALFALDKLWDIEIKLEATEVTMPSDAKGSAGACEPDSSYFQATLYFCEEHIQNESELELTIIHELLHVVMNPLELAARSALTTSHEEVTDMLLESTIERISRAMLAVSRSKNV
jgi:predicted metal-dependent peptidase